MSGSSAGGGDVLQNFPFVICLENAVSVCPEEVATSVGSNPLNVPPVFAFQNGGIVCLKENPEAGGWMIAWSLMPHIG